VVKRFSLVSFFWPVSSTAATSFFQTTLAGHADVIVVGYSPREFPTTQPERISRR
jgi:hypothetical protein